MSNTIALSATCFGKIPSRGDFVKGAGQHQLINLLDRWVSEAMERWSENPRWKIGYDNACSVDFAFVGARSRLSVVGHLKPSTDSSGRRFPFITAATVERDDSLMFRCAPAGLKLAFGALERVSDSGVQGMELALMLAELEAMDCAGSFELAIQADPLGNFVRRTTLDSLAGMLDVSGIDVIRRIILAIGLLMRPILGQGSVSVEKDIVLPLPADEGQRNLVAGLWLYLVSAFLRRTSVEMQVLIEHQSKAPHLVLGFNGASASTLLAALSSESVEEKIISLIDPEWVEDQPDLTNDYGVAKLSAYLAQPHIPLELAINTFREVFLGE